jgi:hypothetical protein
LNDGFGGFNNDLRRLNLTLSPIFQRSNIPSFHKKLLLAFDIKGYVAVLGWET